jgi:hypothetical protein
MVGEKCPPHASPNPVVAANIGAADSTSGRGGDAGFQQRGTGMVSMQDSGGGSSGKNMDSELVGPITGGQIQGKGGASSL